MLLCIVYGILFVDTVNIKIKVRNAFNVMFVETVDTGVCGSYTTPYTEYYEVWKLYSALYKVASCPLPEGKAICYSTVFEKASVFGGLAVHKSKEADLLTFLDLSNYKDDCR